MKIFLQFVGICILIGFIGSLAKNGQAGAAIAIGVALAAIAGVWSWIAREKDRAWKNRPQRLCTNCLAQAQPFQKENGVLYCPHCQADNPAPLESPFARDYFAKQRA